MEARTQAHTRTLHIKYTHTHAHTHTNTNTPPSVARLLAMQLWCRTSHTTMDRLAHSQYLLYNQLRFENNLIHLTGTLCCVVAMPASCPAPGYNFTPLYPTQPSSCVCLQSYYGNAFLPMNEQRHFTDDLNILPSCSRQIYGAKNRNWESFVYQFEFMAPKAHEKPLYACTPGVYTCFIQKTGHGWALLFHRILSHKQ